MRLCDGRFRTNQQGRLIFSFNRPSLQSPVTPTVVLTLEERAWRVPTVERAFEGCLEGRPTEAQRQAILARTREQRASWKPNATAWQQLVELQRFIGRRVRIQFWDPAMYALNEEDWPHPVTADCIAVVTLIDQDHLQAYLALRSATEIKTGGSSGLAYLVERDAVNCTLASVADVYYGSQRTARACESPCLIQSQPNATNTKPHDRSRGFADRHITVASFRYDVATCAGA